jgi:hypothetical protein
MWNIGGILTRTSGEARSTNRGHAANGLYVEL